MCKPHYGLMTFRGKKHLHGTGITIPDKKCRNLKNPSPAQPTKARRKQPVFKRRQIDPASTPGDYRPCLTPV